MKVRCSHPGGSEPCRHCRRRTCATCHHADAHLRDCPPTRGELGARPRRTSKAIPPRPFDTPKSPVRRPAEVPPELRRLLRVRCEGLCELCGERLDASFDVHHRKRRSQGGADHPSNTCALHRRCHQRVHGHVAWAESVGLLLRSTDNPARKPIALHGTTWVRLRADGTYMEAA